mmetsp:Transcript_10093/g.15195  ORF Transcript_10093/g.15195 Transcript_10093/m.15195 type:complete len:346 (+) Transcript_10093:52-1089(+)
MPELPEVECSRKTLEDHCLNSKVVRVEAIEQGGGPRDGQFDDKVIDKDLAKDGFESALMGASFGKFGRKGKILWCEMNDSEKSLVMHFGMTGQLSIKDVELIQYRNSKSKREAGEWPPKFTKFVLEFENGTVLAFTDPRRMGRINIVSQITDDPMICTLAPDPLFEIPAAEYWLEKLGKISAPIKSVLLDQRRIVCGVGNWVADEVLYQAGVHPLAACHTLSRSQVEEIRSKLINIVKVACECNSDSSKYPKNWIFHYRWEKKNGSSAKDFEGNDIVYESVGGRTSAVVKSKMKLGERVKDEKKKLNAESESKTQIENGMTKSQKKAKKVATVERKEQSKKKSKK